jgi:hypothetical protein
MTSDDLVDTVLARARGLIRQHAPYTRDALDLLLEIQM